MEFNLKLIYNFKTNYGSEIDLSNILTAPSVLNSN